MDKFKQVRFNYHSKNLHGEPFYSNSVYTYHGLVPIEEFIQSKIQTLAEFDCIVHSYGIESVTITIEKTVILEKGVEQVEI